MRKKPPVHYSNANPPPTQVEEGGGEVLTNPVGVLTTRQMVERFMDAGVRLKAYKAELYHFLNEESIQEDFEDPTLHPNYDMADASEQLILLENKRKKLLEIKKKYEAIKKAEKEKMAKVKTDDKGGSAESDS